MASPNAPVTSTQLIERHSKARVVKASSKVFTWPSAIGVRYSRQMTDADAVAAQVKKYR